MSHLHEISLIYKKTWKFNAKNYNLTYFNKFSFQQNDLINPIRLEFQTNELSHSTRIKRTNHIQPHTTAAYHDRGGQTHGFNHSYPYNHFHPLSYLILTQILPLLALNTILKAYFSQESRTWFADESKPRIVIFVILQIEISLNFEFLKSEFW